MGQDIMLDAAGRPFHGYIAGAERSGARGVLLLHAWWGLTPFFKQQCDRLAGEGYVVVAPNLFGDHTAATIPEAEALMHLEHDDPGGFQARTLAAVDRLREAAPGGPLGVIGFSMGAAWASVVSTLRPDDVRAVVLFYGTYPLDFSAAKADFLGHYAATDDFEPPEAVREMEGALQKAKLSVTFYTYPGTGHWFFEDNQPAAYNAPAANLAWQRTLDFLGERLKGK